MRFTLRSRRGPHVPIGHDGPKVSNNLVSCPLCALVISLLLKALKREIERRLDLIPRIICEPKLINNTDPRYILFPGQQIPAHYYRLKAVDDVKLLGKLIYSLDF